MPTDAPAAGTPAERRDVVLVVDDSPEALGFLTEALEEAGITALVAMDGPAALASAAEILPDLILMDAVMPGMDGFETCRALKSGEAAHVPVIFMTGLSDTSHVVKGLEAGGVDYVAKPIVIDELLARIRVHLANARLAQSARAALDAAGRRLLAVTATGRLIWATPQAGRLLADLDPGPALPAAAAGWLAAGPAAPYTLAAGERRVELSFLGRTGPDEYLLRLTESGGEAGVLKRHLPQLTGREAEVLRWIAAGKSNRDIGEILEVSPRTVNKHLEQIYAKLGVENRASAAALAVRALGL